MSNFLSRARTPTSPSPSPEPAGPEAGSSQAATNLTGGGGKQGNGHTGSPSDRSRANATGDAIDAHADVPPSAANAGVGVSAGVVQDKAEIARQVLEERIQIGIDDLMQLAMCAGDVQPGDEEIVRMKM
ncbi:hypothetical protein CBS101457_006850 [Exobasidium rhododendri]|nr:hypothetical protein CBS101457_006850 [Exobasidium rhododendri]